MKNYTYQNTLVGKKQLKQILSWSFTTYGSIKACFLADQLKHLGFKYATKAGLSISIEDLRVPYSKTLMLKNATQEILNTEKICSKGKVTDVERFQKVIDTWNITSESLKDEVVSYFSKHDPLNSIYIMAFSGARGNLSQVRQLVGMRGLMSDPSGQIMNLPIKKNFREGLTITDYLMSGYGARKGIVDTALKTANSGYLTRRLIDVAQDIIIREKDCLTRNSLLLTCNDFDNNLIYEKFLGQLINKPIFDKKTNTLIADFNEQITPNLIQILKQHRIEKIYIRSPLTCSLYRSICQKCYGWDLANENIVDIGEAVGIIAGQSIGEPGTQLTMRTFHTGGVFTSQADQQLISPFEGFVKMSDFLKTSKIRTNRGENVEITESSGLLYIIPKNSSDSPVQLELPRNTLLFISNKQYVKQNTILGQLSNSIKQTKTETKQILCNSSGEVFIPKLKGKVNLTTQNKLLWILFGQVFRAPVNSFLNFYIDHKINKNCHIFRSKIVNQYAGFINFENGNGNLPDQFIEIKNYFLTLSNSIIYKLDKSIFDYEYILSIKEKNYFLNGNLKTSKLCVPLNREKSFGTLITNHFMSLTGGIPFYDKKAIQKKSVHSNKFVHFLTKIEKRHYQTVIWLPEETHSLNCEKKLLLIKTNSFISDNFEIIPNVYSKLSGIIKISNKNKFIEEVSIKPGSVYRGDYLKSFDNQLFYPGEILLNTIEIKQISLCEIIKSGSSSQLLIRPIEIYEVPFLNPNKPFNRSISVSNSILKISNSLDYLYSSGEIIKCPKSVNLVKVSLDFRNSSKKTDRFEIEISKTNKKDDLSLKISEKLYLTDYISPYLKYTKIQFSLAMNFQQYASCHTTLGYFEVIANKSLKLVKCKIKYKKNKQIFLITNDDCIILERNKIKSKNFNRLLINNVNINQIGKIIAKNDKFLTIQKGRPYFFPNCKNDNLVNDISLKYKLIQDQSNVINLKLKNKKVININYLNINRSPSRYVTFSETFKKVNFSRMLIKKRGKIYTSSIPIFVREFLIKKKDSKSTILSNLDFRPWHGYSDYKDKIYKSERKSILQSSERIKFDNVFTLFMKSSELIKSPLDKKITKLNFEVASVNLLEYPFKTINIHSITEDYFENEVNSVFCKNGDFIENGEMIGLLNFEKEITGDIVQGLPRIEELLEARKRKRISKHFPKSQKKGLLIRKTTIDATFEFKKIGLTIKENEKINPHSLLKLYFNYFAKVKYLICSENKTIFLCRLSNNYEASHKSFKKIQSLILNSVQSVYTSQGVNIANKHLEIIIKQMTAKVLITHEGQTPLLPREVVDLYHIKYINEVVNFKNKKAAYYVPLLLGITKAALNNPSFISAASFQETTRVLTKAAIEGRLDWLRGLKENIIIGHLIPSGIGCKNYVDSFNKKKIKKSNINLRYQYLKTRRLS
ncbi:MAG: DNA-directed RNA polymerase subunit beta'' [Pelagibacterales bacterium]|nr:DNA-directed RNA polymerase subunit beta'' [Pelagibacterales bacterium]